MKILIVILIVLLDFNTLNDQGFVSSEGVDIYYRTFGSGSPVLIINGGPGMSSEGFIPLATELSGNYKTILFDQRGTGKSIVENPSEHNITMDLMVADMEALRTHLGLGQWTILGHSFGGMLAAYYTSKHPENVRSLIFSSSGGLDMELFSYLDITANLTGEQKDSLAYWNQRIQNGDNGYAAMLGRGRALAPAYLYDKSNVPVIAERLTQGNFEINGLVFSDMRTIGYDCKQALRSFDKPTLIIQGTQDIIDKETAFRTQEVIPHSEIILLEKCSHYGWLDQKEKYFASIKNFLITYAG